MLFQGNLGISEVIYYRNRRQQVARLNCFLILSAVLSLALNLLGPVGCGKSLIVIPARSHMDKSGKYGYYWWFWSWHRSVKMMFCEATLKESAVKKKYKC